MGMFDEVRFEAELPAGHPEGERDFQTKSLSNCLDEFTVSKEGRLVLHSCRFEAADADKEMDGLPLLTRIPLADVDTEFHGDIRLTSTVEGALIEYAARFTHGKLEWIRPWSELSEFHQSIILSRL